jgi:RNA polymerase primary sigma factor
MYNASDDRDLLDLYIEELRHEPVRSAEEQKNLARKMRSTADQDIHDQARSELIRANLRFAFSVAKQYQNRGIPLGDLVSEANAGLVRAADKYDPNVGVNFISYAVWWIRQALHSAVQRQARTVQLPLNRAADLSRVSRAQEVLRQKLSREPYAEEIAAIADLSVDVTRGLVGLLQPTRSLDEPTMTGEGRTLAETLVLDRGEDDDVLPGGVESDSRREAIARALEVLAPRDRQVLTMYFGLDGGEGRPMTLQEIARELGVTRERIRQLRDRALKRLREADTAEALRDGMAA